MNKVVIFTREDAWPFAMGELGALQGIHTEPLTPGAGIITGEGDLMLQLNEIRPLFIRHIHPVQRTADGEKELSLAAGELTASFEGSRIAVHAVDLTGERREGAMLRMLLDSAELARFSFGPEEEWSLSVTRSSGGFYVGFSESRMMLSPRAGGIYRYAMTPDTISRAAFKLTEVFDRIPLLLPSRFDALDLGAAPGGWTKVLLERGAHVTAVDPAELDPRLGNDPRVIHYRGLSQEFLKHAGGKVFDLLVNDMRMDALESIRVTREALPLLKKDGYLVITLKLPEKGSLKRAREAISLLKESTEILFARQLYHNRSEITCIAKKP